MSRHHVTSFFEVVNLKIVVDKCQNMGYTCFIGESNKAHHKTPMSAKENIMNASIKLENAPYFTQVSKHPELEWYDMQGTHNGYFFNVTLNQYGVKATIYDHANHCLVFTFDYKKFSASSAHDAIATAFMMLGYCKNNKAAYAKRATNGCYNQLLSVRYLDFKNDAKDIDLYVR